LDALLDQRDDLADLGSLLGGARRQPRAERLGHERRARQVLAQAVVQVVADRAPLALRDLQDDLFKANALGVLLGERRRALAIALATSQTTMRYVPRAIRAFQIGMNEFAKWAPARMSPTSQVTTLRTAVRA